MELLWTNISEYQIVEKWIRVDLSKEICNNLSKFGIIEVPEPTFCDFAVCKTNKKIMVQIGTDEGETILFSCKVQKKNKFGLSQDRILLLTNQYLYNIKDSATVQRKIGVADIKCITECTKKKSNEFIIHIKKQYDYQYECKGRESIFQAIKYIFWHINKSNIPVYGIDGKIDNFATSKKNISNGEEIPQDEFFRLKNEDMYGYGTIY